MADFRVIITKKAYEDITDIGDYIAYTLHELNASRILVKGLRQSIDSLSRLPYRCTFVDDVGLASQGIRCVPFKNYYIFYKVFDTMKVVIILRIGSNRRNWKQILLN